MFREGAQITSTRRCRICRCAPLDGDGCVDTEHGGRVLRRCHFVGPDLCSFCAEDGGGPLFDRDGGQDLHPDYYSGLLNMYGQPVKWSRLLPK